MLSLLARTSAATPWDRQCQAWPGTSAVELLQGIQPHLVRSPELHTGFISSRACTDAASLQGGLGQDRPEAGKAAPGVC